MSDLWWTIVLVVFGITGLWLAPRHWFGWVVYTLDEVLWEAYAIHRHDPAIAVMAVIWFAVGVRNTFVARKEHSNGS